MRNKLRRNNLFKAYFTALLLILFVFFIIYVKPVEVRNMDVKYIVGGNGGFDVDSTVLTFGRAPPGAVSTRPLIIENKHSFPVAVFLEASPGVADLLSFRRFAYLNPGETTKVYVSLHIPKGQAYGNYTGNLSLSIRRR